LAIASPTSFGHSTNDSKLEFISLQQLKHASNGMNNILRVEQKNATGHAMNQSNNNQISEKQGLPEAMMMMMMMIRITII